MSKKYEAIFIIKNDEDNKKIEEVIEKINNMIISEYCNIFHEEKIGIKRLAYEIKNEKIGYYYLINFETQNESQEINKISIKINTIEEVLKHIIIRMDD